MIDEQEKILEDAKNNAKDNAFFMEKALEKADLKTALKHAALILNQLRTSQLYPKNYEVLWMAVFDHMRKLQAYFKEDRLRGRRMEHLYQVVQHAPNLIPRLYLLITAGSVFIHSHAPGSEKILDDMIVYMKAIQNPLRGLFLRSYFLKMCKDKLPDTGSGYDSEGYGVQQAIEILFTNLRESVNLWMRIGHGRDKNRRQSEKNELRILVGENLEHLSRLEGVNTPIYKQLVLPKLLDVVRNSKDALAQQYILDCIIQGFPEEFHINTLPQILSLCSKDCEKEVDMRLMFIALMERLSSYLSNSANSIEDIPNGKDIYDLFKSNILTLISNSDHSQVKSTLNLYAAFMQFTLKCYPGKHSYINSILKEAEQYCSQNEGSIDEECQGFIAKFLTQPLETLARSILPMSEYPRLLKYLKFKRRRDVAKQIVRAVIIQGLPLIEDELATQVLAFLQPVLRRQADYEDIAESLFKDQQIQVSKLVHLINSPDPTAVLVVLSKFIERFLQGGPERMAFTLPCAMFRLINLAIQMHQSGELKEMKAYKRIFDQGRKIAQSLGPINPQMAVRLYLQLVQVINIIDKQRHFDEFTYETASEALLLYEGQITDPVKKQILLEYIINSCMRLNCISEENYDTLASNIVSFCSKILKKNEQCKLLLSCCYLFTNPMANKSRIHQILKKSNKLASTAVAQSMTNLPVLLELYESYIYFVRQKAMIEDKENTTEQVAELIREKLGEKPEDGHDIQELCRKKWILLEAKGK